ncbi:MAG: ABC transporter permease, partial [Blastocatellia bacterium]
MTDATLYSVGESALLGGAEPQRIHVANVSANLFDVLGVKPRAGRTFLPVEENSKQVYVAVISERLWRSQFGADSSVIGKSIEMNSDRYTIIGVAPAACEFPAGTDVWTPTAHSMRAWIRSHAVSSTILGRMKPGVRVPQLDAQQRVWLQNQPQDKAGALSPSGPLVQSLVTLLIGDLKRPVLLLFGAVILVLLIGCANVASLTIADSIGRRHEFAIRLAVGMTPGRLFRQLVTEHFLVGFVGGLAGLVVAYVSLPYFKTYLPQDWPTFARVSIDGRVLVFALGISALAGLIVGLSPFWRAAKNLDAGNTVSGSRTTETRSSRRWREALVSAETGLALILLISGALFIQTFRNLLNTQYGFKPSNVLVAT